MTVLLANLAVLISSDLRVEETIPIWPVPRAVVAGSPVVELGTLEQGSVRSHEWVIRNAGPRPLEIQMIYCSDTIRFQAPRTEHTVRVARPGGRGRDVAVAPGASVSLVLSCHVPRSNGRFAKRADFVSNDPDYPRFALEFRGYSQPSSSTEDRGRGPGH